MWGYYPLPHPGYWSVGKIKPFAKFQHCSSIHCEVMWIWHRLTIICRPTPKLVSFFGFEGDVKILCSNPQTALACVNTGLLVYCMLIQGITATIGAASANCWIDGDQFIDWLKHFVLHVKPSAENNVILVVDGHASHKSLAVVEYNRQFCHHDISSLSFNTPHATLLQNNIWSTTILGPLKYGPPLSWREHRMQGGMKNAGFRPISRYISETMPDMAIVTTECEWEPHWSCQNGVAACMQMGIHMVLEWCWWVEKSQIPIQFYWKRQKLNKKSRRYRTSEYSKTSISCYIPSRS